MVGAGVFTSSGYSLAALDHPGRVMLAWWLCGLWAVCGAVSYGALVSRLPESGGEYLFLSRFVHPAVGFLAGWISLIAGFTAPIAAAALGAALYGLPIFAGEVSAEDPRFDHFAASLIVIATLCHLVGISLGTRIQNWIVVAKLLLIVVLIGWAFGFTDSTDWLGLPQSKTPQIFDKSVDSTITQQVTAYSWFPVSFAGWTVLAGSMSWIALSYTGFNAAIYVAGESRSAQRLVPIAMLAATVVVTIIYLLLNYVFVYAPQPDSIRGQGNVATVAANAIGGAKLEWLVRVTILLSMTSSVFAMLFAGPRVYQKMSEDGVLPRVFRGKHGSPKVAIAVQAGLSLIALYSASLLELMKYLGLTLSACGALAVLSVFWIRRRLPSSPTLRWWERVCLSVYLSITAMILIASWEQHPVEFNAMMITFAVGAGVYGIWKAFENHPRFRSTASMLLLANILALSVEHADAQEASDQMETQQWASLRLTVVLETSAVAEGIDIQSDASNRKTSATQTADHARPLQQCVLIWDARHNRQLTKHPSQVEPPDSKTVCVTINKDHQFEPPIAVAKPGQTVVLKSPSGGHAPNIALIQNSLPSAHISANANEFPFPISRAEPSVVIPIQCAIHDDARGWIVIQDHDYVGISDKQGRIQISHLPIGRNVFRIWHESFDGDVALRVGEKPLDAAHSRLVLNLKPGVNDLGTLRVLPESDAEQESMKSPSESSDP